MEISNYGSFLNINDYREQALRNGLNSQSPEQNFEEIMRRARAGATSADRSGAVIHPQKEPIDKNDELYKLCLELETFIVKTMVTGMRNTVQKSGLVDESYAGQIYEDMLYDEYAKNFTENANFGLAEQAYRQLKNYY